MDRRQLLIRAAAAFGGALAAPIAMAVRAGAEPGAAITNRVFHEDQRQMTAIIAEMIIPRTDTPGAADAGVPHFIELLVSDWYRDDQRRFFFTGLRDLDNHCRMAFGAGFLACSEAQRAQALESAEANTLGSEAKGVVQPGDPAMWGDQRQDAGARFFNEIKSLTALGYYTSEIGAAAELTYDPVPGAYDGEVSFKDLGKHFIS